MRIDFFSVPVFIISYNRVTELSQLVTRLERDGYTNIHIVDNASTDPDLISYLEVSPHTVHRLDKNWGPYVVWESHLFDDIIQSQWYVVTDPDVIPVEECPAEYVRYFYEVLQEHPEKSKAGFSLKLDDIPDGYRYKYDIWRFESLYWERRICGSESVLYDAPIDTTFALYRPGSSEGRRECGRFFSALRAGSPYIARHLGWYVTDEAVADAASGYYTKPAAMNTSHNEKQMAAFRRETGVGVLRAAGLNQSAYLVRACLEDKSTLRVCGIFLKFIARRILRKEF